MDYSKTFKRALSLSLIVGFLCVGAVACGDDSDDGTPAGTGGVGGASGTGGTGGDTGGTGGASGTGGTGGATGGTGGATGGTGGMAPPEPITCGANTCNPVPTAQGTMLMPCCIATTNACGAVAGVDSSMMPVCTEVGQVGMVDEDSMPCTTTRNALGSDTPGCCRPDNKCGFFSMTLSGCIERTAYPAAFLFDATMPVTDMIDCTYVADEDAGIE